MSRRRPAFASALTVAALTWLAAGPVRAQTEPPPGSRQPGEGPPRAGESPPPGERPPAGDDEPARFPAPPRAAGRYYVGAGALWGNISSGHPSIDGSDGGGLLVVFGLRFAEGIAWDTRAGGLWTRVGPTPEITYPPDRAEYGFLLTGVVWEVQGGGAPVSPWLGAWLGLHFVQWDTFSYDVSGPGLSAGAGVQLRLPLGLLRLGAVASIVDAASTYDAPAGGTTTVLLDAAWLFDWGRP